MIELEESSNLVSRWVTVLATTISIELYPELVSVQLEKVVAEYSLELVYREIHSEDKQH